MCWEGRERDTYHESGKDVGHLEHDAEGGTVKKHLDDLVGLFVSDLYEDWPRVSSYYSCVDVAAAGLQVWINRC